MTMRQLVELRRVMDRRKVIDRYPLMSFLAQINGVKIMPLEEILDPGSTKDRGDFDSKTDELLERRALELLERRKKANGR